MSTYKETVTTLNNDRKSTIHSLIVALENRDEKVVEKMVLKLSIFASKATDIGFSIHDIKTFLIANETAINTYSPKKEYRNKQYKKIVNKIAKTNGIGVKREDVINKNDQFFWLKIYDKKLGARLRLKDILVDQLDKRHYSVFEHEYRSVNTKVNA